MTSIDYFSDEQKKQIQDVRNRLLREHKAIGSWPKLASVYQQTANLVIDGDPPAINQTMLNRVAKSDYIPGDHRICRLLGLPVVHIVPSCPHCGGVHLLSSNTCPNKKISALRNRRIKRKRIEIPANTPDDQLDIIHALSPEERLRRLLNE